MPGANFWAVLFFLTLLLLGISSTYPMLDVVVTGVLDRWGHKVSRLTVATSAVVIAFLISLIYCTQFGYYLLDGVDRWINNLTLVFVVWCECSFSTTVYRWRDVFNQTGLPAFVCWNSGLFGGQLIGIVVGHTVSPAAGAGAGFGVFVVFTVLATAISRTPDAEVPRFWSRNGILRRMWFLGFYSVSKLRSSPTTDTDLIQGNQLRRDLNVVILTREKNWAIPSFWAPLLRYISAPILAIVFSFSYPEFYTLRNDPVYIFGFIVAHFVLLCTAIGFLLPRFLNVFVPYEQRDDGKQLYAPNVLRMEIEGSTVEDGDSPSENRSEKDVKP